MKNPILIIAFALLVSSIWAQSGCTDANANNYEPLAQINDGSCIYDPVILEPNIIVEELSFAVAETSGIIWYRDAIWTHNDSGGEPALYKLDENEGRLLQTIQLINAVNIDYEDITQDEEFIYLGDFGNNHGTRQDLAIYKIKKSDIPEKGDIQLSAEKITFEYKNQLDFEYKNRSNDFDCEAIIAKGDFLYIFTKNWINGYTNCYKIPKSVGHYQLNVHQSFNVRGLITAADYNASAEVLTLIGYENFVPFLWVIWDFEKDDFFGGNKKRVDFAYIQGAQTEAVCFKNKDEILMTCEDSFFPSSLFQLDLEQIINASRDNAPLFKPFRIALKPHPVEKQTVIEIEGLKKGIFDVEIYNLSWKKVSQFSFIEEAPQDIFSVKINTSKLEKGIFFVRVKEGNNIGFQKLMITE